MTRLIQGDEVHVGRNLGEEDQWKERDQLNRVEPYLKEDQL